MTTSHEADPAEEPNLSGELLDWIEAREREAPTPVDRLLNDPSGCRVVSDDVAVHWYPPGERVCYCGSNRR